ncbi:hypothetical protein ML401_23730 [Bradyrhizobium sp. 62B]|uniref:hypothetical protein n=1 Tax=Bradyrhizobium sp. 62B TaxID=2898442 RepID=UPI0025583315|nr:hypothetical protein ML401_23730 [Bradyrhizobium sp. 62B]
MQMSLTQRATTGIAKLSEKKTGLNSAMFANLDEVKLGELNTTLLAFAKNVQLAAGLLAIEAE